MIAWVLSFFADAFYSLVVLGGVLVFLVALFLKPILAATGAGVALLPVVPALRAVGKGIGACAVLWGGWHLFVAQHDASLRAEWVAQQTAAVEAAVAEQQKKGDAAVIVASNAARAAALAEAPVREVIRRVPVQTACAASPAVAAALDELRHPVPASPGAPKPSR